MTEDIVGKMRADVLVERLRSASCGVAECIETCVCESVRGKLCPNVLRHEAAAELTRLRARVGEMEAEIRQIVEAVEPPLNENGVWAGSTVEAVRATSERAESAERERDELRRENERLMQGCAIKDAALDVIKRHCESQQSALASSIVATCIAALAAQEGGNG